MPPPVIDLRQLVDMANANNAQMTGDFAEVEHIIASHDLVFAVWQDQREPEGVGTLIIKGATLLRQSAERGEPLTVRVTAIKCVEAEQAVALSVIIGEGDPRH